MAKCDIKTVTQLLNSSNGNPLASRVKHTVDCGRRDPGKIGQFVGPNSSLIAKLFETFDNSILYCHAASPLIKLYRDVRTHVYALAYKTEMFYTFDSTQSRNESGSERFKNKKGIFHSNNGGYLHFDVIVLNRLIFYHESIEVAIDAGKVKL